MKDVDCPQLFYVFILYIPCGPRIVHYGDHVLKSCRICIKVWQTQSVAKLVQHDVVNKNVKLWIGYCARETLNKPV